MKKRDGWIRHVLGSLLWVSFGGLSACISFPPLLRMPEANPWRLPVEEVLPHLRTICVFPTRIGDEDFTERAQRFSEVAVVELRGAGYQAVPLREDEARGLLEHAVAEVGGVYDPEVGWVDVDRVQAVEKQRRQLAKNLYGCDAFLELSVHLVHAPMNDGIAKWDGRTVQLISWFFGSGTSGWVKALSLYARLTDVEARELYFFAGGIQPVVKANVTLNPLDPTYRVVHEEEVLTSEVDVVAALQLALGPLLAVAPRP